MIEAISPEHGRMKDAATAAASMSYRPQIQTVAPVRPQADLVKSIGYSTNADAFRGSSPDLQALLDALLTNFGTDHDLVESDTRDFETGTEVRENNQGSREAASSLNETANRGQDTVRLDNRLEEQRTLRESQSEANDAAQIHSATENQLSNVESDVDHAEGLWDRAQDATDQANSNRSNPGGEPTSDEQKLKRSADLFTQKAAAAESAARLHRIMVQKVLRNAVAGLEKDREQKSDLESLRELEKDTAFVDRLREMNQLLRSRI